MTLKEIASTNNYYILSWYYTEYVAEVYRADKHDEDNDDTWELLHADTEEEVIKLAFNWACDNETELKLKNQDYKSLHSDDDDCDSIIEMVKI